MGSEGAKHLSEALKVNTTITDLKYATVESNLPRGLDCELIHTVSTP